MYDYADRIEAFRHQKVRLSSEFLDKLLAHRQSNRDRLISRLPDEIPGVTLGQSSFKPQGSVAMQTVIQTKYLDDEYDIDDGLVLWRHQLVDKEGKELSAVDVKEKVRNALKDGRFSRQPKICTNCVRVFYADTDEEKHHVDFPAYRKWEDENGDEQRELAGDKDWVESDPTQVNVWFNDTVESRNDSVAGRGTQFRQLIQLLKRFCRSRPDTEWDMPNGMKLTMLVHECQPAYNTKIDVAFRDLLTALESRLMRSKRILNLAHPDRPLITKSDNDPNVVELLDHTQEALAQLKELDKSENNNMDAARVAWDWIFRSDGFFKEYDDEKKDQEKNNAQNAQDGAYNSGTKLARLGQTALSIFNVPHRQRPQWPIQVKPGRVYVRGYFSRDGFRPQEFHTNSTPLPKSCSLRFEASTTVGHPYRVYWQVVNTGAEASSLPGGLRGGFYDGVTERGGLVRNEGTRYTGSHWIECFIVKHGTCVARSGEFVVNID
jgi:hypothetical protein